jgi:hypothetical protein
MYDILKLCLGFLIDTSKKLAHKIVMVLAVVVLAYLLNNIFGFTYYFNTSRRIEQFKNISELLKDSTLTSEERQYLKNEKKYLIERKNVIQQTIIFFKSRPSVDTIKRTTIDKNNKVVIARKLDPSITYFTACLFFIFLMGGIPYLLFADMAREKNFEYAGGAILSSIIMGLLFYWLSRELLNWILKHNAVFFNQPVLNYTVFLVVNILFILGLIKFARDDEKVWKEKQVASKAHRVPRVK